MAKINLNKIRIKQKYDGQLNFQEIIIQALMVKIYEQADEIDKVLLTTALNKEEAYGN